MTEPVIVGVRHHSPACARLVRETLREVKPARVLIEGPCDMNERLDELALDHQLPVAIFSYYQRDERTHSSWSPLCDYSPEWVALREGRALGAEVRFIDLPAWTHSFRGVANRYADHGRRRLAYVATLCERLGIDGLDPLWDHLFEQPMPTEELRARLELYFVRLREAEGGVINQADEARELHMAMHLAQAMHEDAGPVVVVCGGYHAPALAEDWKKLDGAAPPTPEPAGDARHGSYLVPYSFHRLDAFTGYEAGMPSPAYYQELWEHGPQAAGERMLELAVKRLREKGQSVSAADLIAAETMTRGLMRLRGHAAMARVDLLDGVAAALVNDALEVPLPWTRRGPLAPGTDPLLVVVVAALSGKRRGELAPGTPRPPLVADVQAELSLHDLLPVEGKRLERVLDLTDPEGLQSSRVLHRLRVLNVPGFVRDRGPALATDAELTEAWTIMRALDADSALVEAAAFGATLEAAAGARLEELMRGADGNLDVLARVLAEALFVGLSGLAARVLDRAREQVHQEAHLERLGGALGLLLAIWRHDRLFGAARSPQIGAVIEAMVARGIWLFEGRSGATATTSTDELRAVIAIRDAVRYGGGLDLDAVVVHDVMARRAVDAEAPPAHRGAALGYLWSMRTFADEADAQAHAVLALRKSSQPEVVGELLAGLFALAREEVIAAPALVEALDQILGQQTWHDFLVAVPSLRLAFSWFPPRERDQIARLVLGLHGAEDQSVRKLRRLSVDPTAMTRAVELEQRVDAIERRYGLTP
ncbi:MAG: hypothetical protein H6719_07765 [Sandaracinaceae bacterium]|nr:hypothetical protein [Sandaracinaceae bacterium]